MTTTDGRPATPAEAWQDLLAGNERFLAGAPLHPRQGIDRVGALAAGQHPRAALFGCSDSRLAAEIVFDLGLGDLFVVRNAGQVVSDSVIGSLEYAVGVLGVPLVVVLGHDSCGAVAAAIDSERPDAAPLPAHIARLIAGIVPAVRQVAAAREVVDASAPLDAAQVGRQHLRDTVAGILAESELISDAVAAGTLALVGANYRLGEGRAVADLRIGAL